MTSRDVNVAEAGPNGQLVIMHAERDEVIYLDWRCSGRGEGDDDVAIL